MSKTLKVLLSIIGIVVLVALLYFTLTPSGRADFHEWRNSLKETDEQAYEYQKEVEDTCRAMISSYNSDKLIYQQYKDSEKTEEVSWANNAKIRANQTASTYNNYVLKNTYVWKENVPSDIFMILAYIE